MAEFRTWLSAALLMLATASAAAQTTNPRARGTELGIATGVATAASERRADVRNRRRLGRQPMDCHRGTRLLAFSESRNQGVHGGSKRPREPRGYSAFDFGVARVPGSRCLVLGPWSLVLGSWSVPGAWSVLVQGAGSTPARATAHQGPPDRRAQPGDMGNTAQGPDVAAAGCERIDAGPERRGDPSVIGAR